MIRRLPGSRDLPDRVSEAVASLTSCLCTLPNAVLCPGDWRGAPNGSPRVGTLAASTCGSGGAKAAPMGDNSPAAEQLPGGCIHF